MIARAYVRDGDLTGAFDRLRPLGEANIPDFVQSVTERTISASGDVADIRVLVALSAGLGRLTPIMEPYRQAQGAGSGARRPGQAARAAINGGGAGERRLPF